MVHTICLQKARGHGGYGKAVAMIEVEAETFFKAQDMVVEKLKIPTNKGMPNKYRFSGLLVGGFGTLSETKIAIGAPTVRFEEI